MRLFRSTAIAPLYGLLIAAGCWLAPAVASGAVEAGGKPAGGSGGLAAGRGWRMPEDISLEGYRIDNLIHITGVFVTLLFVIMVIWMATAIIKHNKNHEAEYDHGSARTQVLHALMISAAIFFVVDGNLFVNSTWDTYTTFWNFDKAGSNQKALRIEINARQWAWDVRYAGPDGRFNTADDIVTLNDLRIPNNAPVLVQLAATDVIHSFYLPHLRVKTDAVPGMINRFWFQATKTGRYEIACAQHCGIAHYKMAGVLTVLPEDDYVAWAARASANSARAYDAEDTRAHWGWPWERGEK